MVDFQLFGDGDRTLRGYDLYAQEAERRIADAEKKVKKYKEREKIVIALAIGSFLLVCINVLLIVVPK